MAINSLSASSYGLSGLVSGIDTQSMVESMLSGTKTKITTQQQKLAQLEYKQQLYRGITSKLQALQQSYFKFGGGSSTVLASDAFFQKMATNYTSSAFKVTAASGAATGTNTMKVTQLAKAYSQKTNFKATGSLSGKFDSDSLKEFMEGRKAEIILTEKDGTPITLDLTKLVTDASAGKSLAGLGNSEAAALLNDAVKKAYADKGIADSPITVTYENGKINFTSTTGKAITVGKVVEQQGNSEISKSTDAFNVFGLTQSQTSTNGTLSLGMDTTKLQPSIDVTFDGVKKTIYFDPGALTDDTYKAENVANSLQEEVNKAFGRGIEVKADAATGEISFKSLNAADEGEHTITITGDGKMMNSLGIISGMSNKISTGMRLNQINFGTALSGDVFSFKINGVDFNITSDRTLSSVISEINNSGAGVTLSYSQHEDKFTLTSQQMGADGKITYSQSEGNFLTAILGNVNDADSGQITQGSANVTGKSVNSVSGKYSGSFTNYGGDVQLYIGGENGAEGRVVTLAVPSLSTAEARKSYKVDDYINTLNAGLRSQGITDVSFSYNSNTKETTLVTPTNRTVQIVADGNGTTKLSSLGLSAGQGKVVGGGLLRDGDTNVLGLDDTISFTVDGTTTSYTYDSAAGGYKLDGGTDVIKTVDDLAAKMQDALGSGTVAFDNTTGRMKITGVAGENKTLKFDGDSSHKLFSSDTLVFNQVADASHTVTKTDGQAAEFELNGIKMTRNSNVFTVDGLTFELYTTSQRKDEYGNPVFQTDASGNQVPVYDTPTNIEVTRDTDQIYDGLVKFVEEYNEVMKYINDLLLEDPNYKDYPPLTDEQKAELTDKEIEMWEEKSKEGLLRGDSTLESIVSSLRSAVYQKPDGSPYGIYGIGITTSYDSNYGIGTLTLKNGGSDLRAAIESDPEMVRQLFTAADGFAANVSSAIDAAASSSLANPGKLVRLAGATGMTDTTSSIYKQSREIKLNIEDLKDRYESEYNRYWKQFNTMEQLISQMNQQSSWLSQQFSS